MKNMRIISLLAASNSRTQLKTKSILSKSLMLMASLGLSKQAEARESEIIKHKDDNQTTSSELSNQGEDKAIVEKVTVAELEEDQLSNNLNQIMLGTTEPTELGVILLAQNDVSPSVESKVGASYNAVDNTPSKAHVTDVATGGLSNMAVTGIVAGGLIAWAATAKHVEDQSDSRVVNDAPSDIKLSSKQINENQSGVVVGSLTTIDANDAATSYGQHTYTVDDARFEVVNNQLKLKAGVSLDHEAAGTLNVTVTATDGGGLAKSQVFAITVSDVNEAPTAVTLNSGTSATVAENAVAAALGAISISDADSATTSNGQHTYTVDDARFEVVNDQLKLKAGVSLDHEAAGTLNVTVMATDGGGLTKSQVFAITVSDVNEAPTAVTLNSGASASVAENAVAAALGAISTSDADSATTSNGQHTYTVDDARFEVVNNQLKLKAGVSLDHEAAGTLNVTVMATDGGGLTKSQVFAITVSDVNEAPTAVTLNSGASASVAENAVAAALGAISTSDADSATTSNGQHTYTVDDARFEVVNNQLKLKAGVSLDHEAAGTLNVTVTATDGGGLAKSQVFAITVSDVKELVSLTGTVSDDGFNYATSLDNFVVNSLAGNDVITTGAGNDMVRPSEGADNVNTGAANDVIVVVGQTAANQYTQKDIKNPANSGIDVSSVVSLDTLNNRSTSEVQAGEHIDGGAGVNHLIVYGETDLTIATIANIQQIHVNSTLTLSAQQFNALPLTMLLGNGDSTLKLSNIGNTPIIVDLSKVQLLDFKTVSIDAGITLIADQTDINSLKYITGDGVLKASTSADVLNLTGKTISVDVQNKDGMIHTTHGATIVSGDIIIGSELSDTLNGSSIADRLEGGGGNDTLTGGDGNDIIRGGAGVDKMDGGAGDDTFVVVGDLSGGGKVDSLADTAALAEGLTNFNGKNLNEDEDGAVETIIGGAGDDTLYVYGSADISKYDLSGIEHIELRSDVPLNVEQLQGVSTLSGDGSSILRIVKVANSPAGVVELDLSTLDLSNLAEIFIDADVVLKISSLEDLGGARILTGAGTLKSANGTLVLPNTFSIQNTLHVDQIDATQADKLTEIFDKSSVGGIIDSSGNDYLRGTDYEDVLTSVRGGNDVLTGKKGSDTFRIAGEGKKIILDVDNKNDVSAKDTLDFSFASGAAQVDLTSGGTVGGATIQLGSGSATGGTQQTASKFNLMLIVDVSGSMGQGTGRMEKAKLAATELINAYDNLGDVSVRMVKFSTGASSSFNGKSQWLSADEAKGVIGGFVANGGTNYSGAMTVAKQAFVQGKEAVYYQNGNNVSFFLSDGEPNSGYSAYPVQTDWEDFLIANQIQSNALGFGGINSTYALEPLAFDGTKVTLTTDDHTPGEIPALVAPNISQLGDILISQAKLSFIENAIGTSFDDKLTGNNLDNELKGNAGNDELKGLGGDDVIRGGDGTDTVLFRGSKSDYEIKREDGYVVFKDKVAGRDGVDKVYNVEKVGFGVTAAVDMDSLLLTAPVVVGITEKYPFLTLARFSEASYDDSEGVTARDVLINDEGWKAVEIFNDGMFTNGTAAALVATKGDSLVVSFRGADDWIVGDLPGLVLPEAYYHLSYGGFTSSLKDYIIEHSEIQKVFVTGHGLGGAMTTLFLADMDGGGYYHSKNLSVLGAAFGAPEIFPNMFASPKIDAGIPYYRFEIAKDVVPDVVDILEGVLKSLAIQKLVGLAIHKIPGVENAIAGVATGAGSVLYQYLTPIVSVINDTVSTQMYSQLSKYLIGKIANSVVSKVISTINDKVSKVVSEGVERLLKNDATVKTPEGLIDRLIGYSPGIQINLLTTDSVTGYDSPLDRHSISEYIKSIQLLDDIGLIDDLAFARYEKDIFGDYSKHTSSPSDAITLDVNTGKSGASLVGDSGSIVGEFVFAERYSENDLIVGTNANDMLVGDGGGSVDGTNDLFYVGRGQDTVYGHQAWDDNGGLDVVVYNFSDTLIAQGKLGDTYVTGDLSKNTDATADTTGGINIANVNVDGSPDKLADIEKLHFIDTASDATNLLVGGKGNDVINALAGNDYLAGGAGNDTLDGGSSIDRIHGGIGTDTAYVTDDQDHTSASIENWSVKVESRTDIDYLYSVEKLQFVDGVVASTKDVLNISDIDLLKTYAPVIAYSLGDTDDVFSVYGFKEGNTLYYGIYEDDTYSLTRDGAVPDLDTEWYFQINIGEDLLPEDFMGMQRLGEDKIQVRNPFDNDISHAGNSLVVYIRDIITQEGNLNLAEYYDYPLGGIERQRAEKVTWLAPFDIGSLDMQATNGVGTTYQLKGGDDDVRYYDVQIDASKAKSGFHDYTELFHSDNYKATTIDGKVDYTLAGLEDGQMDAGFLFDDTPLAPLGHFDLV